MSVNTSASGNGCFDLHSDIARFQAAALRLRSHSTLPPIIDRQDQGSPIFNEQQQMLQEFFPPFAAPYFELSSGPAEVDDIHSPELKNLNADIEQNFF